MQYLKSFATDTGIPWQSLLNLYLRDCAASRSTIDLKGK
nr:hypothetical protein [Methyloversatilis sp. RAC08]